MIKATDLRLGNKVLVNGQICTVNNLFPNNIRVAELSVLHQINHESLYEPVPLTPEILAQCGFVKMNDGVNDYLGLAIHNGIEMATIRYYEGGLKAVALFVREIMIGQNQYYLHQLQNIYYALTREELQYRPDYHIEEAGEIKKEDFDNLKPRP